MMQYRSHRYPTTFPVALQTRMGVQRAQVTDVNTTGARISGVWGIGRGDKVQLTILNQRVDGVVRWMANGTMGIVFRPALTDSQVDTLRYRPDARRQSGPGQVGFRFAELS
jgi:hypothetical protein